jgi:L-alanine-DL-glutamate epimerase-like enolase superfamily enzyme
VSWSKAFAEHEAPTVTPGRVEIPVRRFAVAAYTVPTDAPESDGTLEWDSTTVVAVHIEAGDETGFGYSYTHEAAAKLIDERLRTVVEGADALDIPRIWQSAVRAVRNLGRPGIASAGIAALDCALWDLKARLLGLPLVSLLGRARDAVETYGSGGFTSYSVERLQRQLAGWVEQGLGAVKMKVGREPENDVARVRAAREAIGDDVLLMVDANGGYSRKQALEKARAFSDYGVRWFEEPVSSDDLEGLRLLRCRAPAGMEIAAGEYGDRAVYFRRMVETGAVDVLQADATRCAGITGFLEAAAICRAFTIPLSAHTAPSLHCAPGCSAPGMRHVEYFHDHVRLEGILLDGAVRAEGGRLRPDLSRRGAGFDLKKPDADEYLVFAGGGK